MKFELDSSSDPLLVRSYGRDHLVVADQRLTAPVVIAGSRLLTDLLPSRVAELRASHVRALAALGAEIVILGTGARQAFLTPEWLAIMESRGVGLETMDTAAACRSYNVLRSEDRAVALAVFMQADESGAEAGGMLGGAAAD